MALARALDLDHLSFFGHDDVEVDLGGGVLLVVQVEEGRPLYHAGAGGGHRAAEGLRR